MKEILILRHAKSSWGDSSLSDHDRPLKKRGLRDAPRIGQLLAERDLVPDVILCSTAVRARQTAERVLGSCGREVPVHFTKELYLAGPSSYLDLLAELFIDLPRCPSSEYAIARICRLCVALCQGAVPELESGHARYHPEACGRAGQLG